MWDLSPALAPIFPFQVTSAPLHWEENISHTHHSTHLSNPPPPVSAVIASFVPSIWNS